MPARSLIKTQWIYCWRGGGGGGEGGGGGGGRGGGGHGVGSGHSAEEGQNPLAEHAPPPDRIRWRIVSPRTESASGFCPPGQNPLADCVRGDTFFWKGGGTKSAMTPAYYLPNHTNACVK